MGKQIGRKIGSRNLGYFYRTGRGWATKVDGKFVPLEFENGDRMRDRNTPGRAVMKLIERVDDKAANEQPASDAA